MKSDLIKYLYQVLVIFSGNVLAISLGGMVYAFYEGWFLTYIEKFFLLQEKLFDYILIVSIITLVLDIVVKNFTRLIGLMDDNSLKNFRKSLILALSTAVIALVFYMMTHDIWDRKLFWILFSVFFNVFALIELLRRSLKEDSDKYWEKQDKIKENAIELSQASLPPKRALSDEEYFQLNQNKQTSLVVKKSKPVINTFFIKKD